MKIVNIMNPNFKIFTNRKLPAFTIVELMVSMVILLTVISIGVLLWTNVVRGIGKFQSDSDLYYNYLDLTNRLEQDLNNAVRINMSGRVLNLSNDTNESNYTFYSDSVTLENRNSFTAYYIKSTIIELNYYEDTDIVNGLFIEFTINGKKVPYHIHKPIRGRFQINTLFENGN